MTLHVLIARVQVWMFANYGNLALIFPFIVLFYKLEIHMSESTIGLLSGLRPCLGALFGESIFGHV